MKSVVITTMNQLIYDKYGRRLVESFDDFFPENVDFYLYTEDDLKIKSKRPIILDSLKEIPELTTFLNAMTKEKYGKVAKSIKKFSHKVYVQCHAFRHLPVDHIHWMDADIYPLTTITNHVLENAIGNNFSVFMGQHMNSNPETGYIGFNLNFRNGIEFINYYQNTYDSLEIVTLQPRPWDPIAYWQAKEKFKHKLKFESITAGTKHSHVFRYSYWNEYLSHAKGRSKYNNPGAIDKHLEEIKLKLIK